MPVSQPVISPSLSRFSGKSVEVRVDDTVGPVGGDDPALPAAVPDFGVPLQIVERALGGGDHLDVEALEKGARAESVLGQAVRDPVVMRIGVGGGERFIDAEQGLQHIVEPQTRRRATEQVIVLGKAPPDGAALGFDRCSVKARHPKVLETDALAEQHAVDVMIGNDEQPGRIGKGLVERIPAWIRMAVGTDDGQAGNPLIQAHAQSTGRPVRQETAGPDE